VEATAGAGIPVAIRRSIAVAQTSDSGVRTGDWALRSTRQAERRSRARDAENAREEQARESSETTPMPAHHARYSYTRMLPAASSCSCVRIPYFVTPAAGVPLLLLTREELVNGSLCWLDASANGATVFEQVQESGGNRHICHTPSNPGGRGSVKAASGDSGLSRRTNDSLRYGRALRLLALAACLLTVFFVVVSTSHIHSDGQSDGACQICQVAHFGVPTALGAGVLPAPLMQRSEPPASVPFVPDEQFLSSAPSRAPPSA